MFLYHIIVFTVPGIIRYPNQLIDINSTSLLVTFCIGGVAKCVKGVLEYFIQCIRYSAIFCMGVYCSELDKAVRGFLP